jgi:hypothetical protein
MVVWGIAPEPQLNIGRGGRGGVSSIKLSTLNLYKYAQNKDIKI